MFTAVSFTYLMYVLLLLYDSGATKVENKSRNQDYCCCKLTHTAGCMYNMYVCCLYMYRVVVLRMRSFKLAHKIRRNPQLLCRTHRQLPTTAVIKHGYCCCCMLYRYCCTWLATAAAIVPVFVYTAVQQKKQNVQCNTAAVLCVMLLLLPSVSIILTDTTSR